MTQRLQYIDIAKGLGILLVVLGHNRSLTEALPSLHAAIYLFHMPLFFFLSGLTAPAILNITQLTRRVTSLMKPYIVGIVLILPLQLRQADHPSNDGVIAHSLWGTGNAIFNTPLWFLSALATGYCAYAGIQWIRARWRLENRFPLLACLLIIASYMLLSQQIGFDQLPHDHLNRPMGAPFSLDLAPLTAGVLLLGHWWHTTSGQRGQTNNAALIAICLTIVLALLLLWQVSPALDLNYRAVQAWPVALAFGVLGIAGTMTLSMLLANIGASNGIGVLGYWVMGGGINAKLPWAQYPGHFVVARTHTKCTDRLACQTHNHDANNRYHDCLGSLLDASMGQPIHC
jgi:fucose 4-O-acetylase-like acetyltransferase